MMPLRSRACALNWTTFCFMSNNLDFRCPVCRAKQTLHATCRRCNADLRLVASARRRIEYLLTEIEMAQASGNHQREASLAAELQWLAPNHQYP